MAEDYSRVWTGTRTCEGHAPSPLLTALSSGDSPGPEAPRWALAPVQLTEVLGG